MPIRCAIRSFTPRAASLLVAVSVAAALSAAGPAPACAQAGPGVGALERAKASISAGDYTEGLAAAREAQRTDPTDYRAKYYVAMSLYGLGQLEDAGVAADDAYAIAPEGARGTINELREKIRSTGNTGGKLAEAEAALKEGLYAKAAKLFLEVWSSDPTQYEAAFKASEIRATRLNDPLGAAALLVAIKSSTAPPTDIVRAEEGLSTLAPRVKIAADAEIARARKDPTWRDAKARLNSVLLADPENGAANLAAFELGVAANDLTAVTYTAKALGRASRFDLNLLLDQPNIETLVARPEFVQLVRDIAGEEVARQLKFEFTTEGRIFIVQSLVRTGGVALAGENVRNEKLQSYYMVDIVDFGMHDNCRYIITTNPTMRIPNGNKMRQTRIDLSFSSQDYAFSDLFDPRFGFSGQGKFFQIMKAPNRGGVDSVYLSLTKADERWQRRFRRAFMGLKAACDRSPAATAPKQ